MKKILFFVMVIGVTVACNNEKESGFVVDIISGNVQKGPFLNGTDIEVQELESNLTPTGKTYFSQITDNSGLFVLNNLSLPSEFVLLKANGFYFNEITNSSSLAPITLRALTNLQNKSYININILTSIETNRVEYLISQGNSFEEAKAQAQKEVLAIFEINENDIINSELLDISNSGKGNAILLSISAIMQGDLSEGELSELIANISNDIEGDGVLDSQDIGTILINNANYLQLEQIRANLELRYNNLGFNVSIPDFEIYVSNFIEGTDFVFTDVIQYPEYGLYGENLLDKEKINYENGTHSLSAILPKGSSLKVAIQGQNASYPVSQDWDGWSKKEVDGSLVFESKSVGNIDLQMHLSSDTSSVYTQVYVFENGASTPTWSKTIFVE